MTKHFFDIGGNIGQTFDWLATLDDDYRDHVIWVFEPSPRHFAKLIEKCKSVSNKYEIKLCPFGIGGKNSTLKFYEKDDDKGDSFKSWLASDHEVTNIDNGYEVVASMISLPEFILQNTASNDSIVLDIDTEGSEYEILDALLNNKEALSRVKLIITEFHFIEEKEKTRSKSDLVKGFEAAGVPLQVRGFA